MTTQISGDTGVSAIQSGVVVQADLAANVVGNGPAFGASFGTVGTINGSLLLQPTEEFDTAGAYSAGRFTPLVAGYYQVSASLQVSATTCAYAALQIKRTGLIVATVAGAGYSTAYGSAALGALVYLNGTTDYIEIFQDISVTGTPTIVSCRTGAFLARAA